jgi:hypothetical protein
MSNFEKELEKLRLLKDKEAFKKQYETLLKDFPELESEIDSFVKLLIRESVKEIDAKLLEITVKMQLGDDFEYLPLAYIARTYFKKSRSWLYQRLKGNIVNGKPARFTSEQIKTLNLAFKELGNKMASIEVHLPQY